MIHHQRNLRISVERRLAEALVSSRRIRTSVGRQSRARFYQDGAFAISVMSTAQHRYQITRGFQHGSWAVSQYFNSDDILHQPLGLGHTVPVTEPESRPGTSCGMGSFSQNGCQTESIITLTGPLHALGADSIRLPDLRSLFGRRRFQPKGEWRPAALLMVSFDGGEESPGM